MITQLELLGEKLYRCRKFRIIQLAFFLIAFTYVMLWAHEAFHYYYATAILNADAYIKYHSIKVMGWCYSGKEDLIYHTIGGLGTALFFFLFYFFAAAFPNRLSLPYDVSLFWCFFVQLIYTPLEVASYFYPELLKHTPIVTVIAIFITTKIYFKKVVEYIRWGNYE
jgi:hypothetical protein